MRNSKTHSQTTKQKIDKCSGIFYSYNELQKKYGEQLSKRTDVLEFKANVRLDGFPLGDTYTTNFVITTTDGRLQFSLTFLGIYYGQLWETKLDNRGNLLENYY